MQILWFCLWTFRQEMKALSIVVSQSLSCAQHFVTLFTATHQASFTISWSMLRFTPTELVMPSNLLILCRPLLLPLSSFSVFSNDLALCSRWPKVSELQGRARRCTQGHPASHGELRRAPSPSHHSRLSPTG